MPEDRTAIEAGLNASLSILGGWAQHLPKFAEEKAAELGLTYFAEPASTDAPVLRFIRTDLGEEHVLAQHLKGPSAWEQLPAIGKITGFFALPQQLLLGIRGETGDVLMRVTDMQRYRFEAVAEYIREQSIDKLIASLKAMREKTQVPGAWTSHDTGYAAACLDAVPKLIAEIERLQATHR